VETRQEARDLAALETGQIMTLPLDLALQTQATAVVVAGIRLVVVLAGREEKVL
jgi:hypothetical protein